MAMTRGGARLAYVVVALEGTVQREVVEYVNPKTLNGRPVQGKTREERRKHRKNTGLVRRMLEQPAGYMVYFPRGHCMRFRDEEHLAHYGLDKEADIINMQGLHNPKSAIGKLLRAQDEKSRKGAFESLEKQVIQLATAKSGPVVMPEQLQAGGRQAIPEAA